MPVRSAAAEAISKSHLSAAQLDRLCVTIQSAGPLELNRLLKPFDRSSDEKLGMMLLSSLKKSPALPSLRLDLLREALAKYSPNVQKAVVELESHVNVDAASQRKRIEELAQRFGHVEDAAHDASDRQEAVSRAERQLGIAQAREVLDGGDQLGGIAGLREVSLGPALPSARPRLTRRARHAMRR